MCGIAGILRVHTPAQTPPTLLDSIPEAWLDILDDSIKHRGPDGRGRFRQRVVRPDGAVVDVALVHRRLSIIDLAGGGQPMVIGTPINGSLPRTRSATRPEIPMPPEPAGPLTSDRHPPALHPSPALLSMEGAPYAPPPRPHTCPGCSPGVTAVAFNGCIYNHRDLRRELQAAGHVFHTEHSDTEVLLHAWRQWGPHLIDHLDGMYAFLIWDDASGSVCAGRDEFGEKPLFDHLRFEKDVIAWCGSAAGMTRLLTVFERPMKFGWAADASRWLSMGSGPDLPTSWCNQPPPGRCRVARVGDGVPELWQVETGRFGLLNLERRRDQRLWPDRVEELLEDSLRARLDADVPMGCFLSGGVDSSLLALLARRHLGELRTFTVRMPDPAYDESAQAEQMAHLIGTRHETLDTDANPATDLVRLIEQLGLPFGDSSLLPTYWLAEAARRHVKVAISGDGGDEMFCGYERHVAIQRLRRWRAAAQLIPSPLLPRRNPKSTWSKLARLGVAARARPNLDLAAIFPTPDLRRLAGHAPRGRGGIRDGALWDVRCYLSEDLLRKADTASMAVALEVRAPFLSRELALAALSEPLSSLMPHGQRKGLLRAVARKYLPAHIVDRPKQGFAIPISDWLRTDYGGMRQLMMDHLHAPDPFPGLAEAGINLNMPFIEQMIREHDAAGQASPWPWKGRDHGQRLYMLTVLSIWCKWLERVRASRAAPARG